MAPRKSLAQSSDAGKLLAYVLQLSLLALYKVSAPVSRVFAFYWWLGSSVCKLAAWVEKVFLKLVAWLSSPALARGSPTRAWIRQYAPMDVRRWHLVIGEARGGTFGVQIARQSAGRADRRPPNALQAPCWRLS